MSMFFFFWSQNNFFPHCPTHNAAAELRAECAIERMVFCGQSFGESPRELEYVQANIRVKPLDK